jgi:hypothetical protein
LWKKDSFSVPGGLAVEEGSWTRATPRVRRMRETHFWRERVRLSIVTLKRAVVRILSW